MNRSINDGSQTHIRYAHYRYPRLVELNCPKCQEKALAINKNVPEDIEHFMDIDDFEKLWNINCLICHFQLMANWYETKQLELRLKTEIKGIEFWAWNQEHLKMILKRLRNENLKSDKWELFATYIPGKWLSKLREKRELRKIEKLLQQ